MKHPSTDYPSVPPLGSEPDDSRTQVEIGFLKPSSIPANALQLLVKVCKDNGLALIFRELNSTSIGKLTSPQGSPKRSPSSPRLRYSGIQGATFDARPKEAQSKAKSETYGPACGFIVTHTLCSSRYSGDDDALNYQKKIDDELSSQGSLQDKIREFNKAVIPLKIEYKTLQEKHETLRAIFDDATYQQILWQKRINEFQALEALTTRTTKEEELFTDLRISLEEYQKIHPLHVFKNATESQEALVHLKAKSKELLKSTDFVGLANDLNAAKTLEEFQTSFQNAFDLLTVRRSAKNQEIEALKDTLKINGAFSTAQAFKVTLLGEDDSKERSVFYFLGEKGLVKKFFYPTCKDKEHSLYAVEGDSGELLYYYHQGDDSSKRYFSIEELDRTTPHPDSLISAIKSVDDRSREELKILCYQWIKWNEITDRTKPLNYDDHVATIPVIADLDILTLAIRNYCPLEKISDHEEDEQVARNGAIEHVKALFEEQVKGITTISTNFEQLCGIHADRVPTIVALGILTDNLINHAEEVTNANPDLLSHIRNLDAILPSFLQQEADKSLRAKSPSPDYESCESKYFSTQLKDGSEAVSVINSLREAGYQARVHREWCKVDENGKCALDSKYSDELTKLRKEVYASHEKERLSRTRPSSDNFSGKVEERDKDNTNLGLYEKFTEYLDLWNNLKGFKFNRDNISEDQYRKAEELDVKFQELLDIELERRRSEISSLIEDFSIKNNNVRPSICSIQCDFPDQNLNKILKSTFAAAPGNSTLPLATNQIAATNCTEITAGNLL